MLVLRTSNDTWKQELSSSPFGRTFQFLSTFPLSLLASFPSHEPRWCHPDPADPTSQPFLIISLLGPYGSLLTGIPHFLFPWLLNCPLQVATDGLNTVNCTGHSVGVRMARRWLTTSLFEEGHDTLRSWLLLWVHGPLDSVSESWGLHVKSPLLSLTQFRFHPWVIQWSAIWADASSGFLGWNPRQLWAEKTDPWPPVWAILPVPFLGQRNVLGARTPGF